MPQPLITVWLDSVGNRWEEDNIGGLFTFGDIDSQNYEANLTDWVPLADETWWEFAIDNCTVGGKTISAGTSHVVSDTGTSLLVGDSKLVKKVAKQVGATYYSSYALYFINCDATYDPVSFSINGKVYNLTSDVLTMDVGLGGNLCLFGVDPMDGLTDVMGLDWIL